MPIHADCTADARKAITEQIYALNVQNVEYFDQMRVAANDGTDLQTFTILTHRLRSRMELNNRTIDRLRHILTLTER